MSLPLAQRDEEICRQISELLQSDEGTAHLIGMLGSLVSNQMVQMEYMNVLAESINTLCTLGNVPLGVINFYDFIDTHDMTEKQRKEWMEQKSEQWRNRRRKEMSGLVGPDGKKI